VKFKTWAKVTVFSCVLAGPAFAQSTAATTIPAQEAAPARKVETVIVTGSSIRRQVETSALPLQILSREDLLREGISSPEQLVAGLSSNVAGMDNLASNGDVTDNRSARGASFANLRGQGSSATLVLLNGRRVAAHGLNGGAVDLNQLPIVAMQRVDILKDGASAVYGTDAIGGVINFITRKDFQGLNVQTFSDITEEGGGNINRISLLGGYGDIETQKFNIMAVLGYRKNDELLASERDFVNAFQPQRGLSVDTRGTPFGTIFALNRNTANSATQLYGPYMPSAGTLLGNSATTGGATVNVPFVPGSTTIRAIDGVNPLNLPGNLGCNAIPGMADYFEQLWLGAGTGPTPSYASAQFACAWDSGDSASILQEQETANAFVRGVARLGKHEFIAEYIGSDATADNRFSEAQVSSNNQPLSSVTSLNLAYFRIPGVNDTVYDRVANQLVAAFPNDAGLAARRAANLPIAMRWRCLECGRREISTNTKTGRFFLGAEGPLGFADWAYRAGASSAFSESVSTLGSGYYFNNAFFVDGVKRSNGIVDVFNSGIINPFLLPGEKQSAAALAALETASARGTKLFGGRFEITQIDASASGPLFGLWGGKAYGAVGVDFRTETFEFNGDERPAAERPNVLLAPFDQTNLLAERSRDVKAVFAELFLPVFKNLELTLAIRTDEYDGFGKTTNPKVSVKYQPLPGLMFRASQSTGFRVPSFAQIYFGETVSPISGNAAIPDPKTCPTLIVSNIAGCEDISNLTNVTEVTGGNLALGPEESEQVSLGFVANFAKNISVSVDWWEIERTGTIGVLSRTLLLQNYAFFEDKFIRDGSGRITRIDRRNSNVGGTLMSGLEITARNSGNIWGGRWSVSMEGTQILNRQTKILPGQPYGLDETGRWTRFQDLTLEWRHNATATFTRGNWSGSLSQVFRSSYLDNFTYPGIGAGSALAFIPDLQIRVPNYTVYNTSMTYKGFKNFAITAGIRNLLNTEPPFTRAYDSGTGSGSSWESRVADPRGRAYTLTLDYNF
jgi:iron complex outermembrane recepter protein